MANNVGNNGFISLVTPPRNLNENAVNVSGLGAAKHIVGVDNRSYWYDLMSSKWKKVDALLDGTTAMRAAGKTYLPKFPIEPEDSYKWRTDTAVLTNFFKHMAEQMVGKIFSKSIELKTNIPEDIIQNIDRQGSSFNMMARQSAFDLITKGLSHIFVDFPKVEKVLTIKESKERKVRPFWVRVPPENLFAASTSYINDEDNLSQVRWLESGVDILGFQEHPYSRIRSLQEKYLIDEDGNIILSESGKPIQDGYEWQIWETTHSRIFPPRNPIATSGGYALVERGNLTLDEIPLATAYADKTGFYTSSLPLEDVAYLNIQHFQAASDLNNIIRLSQAPLFFMKGFNEKPEAKGSNLVYFIDGDAPSVAAADMKYVEPTGTGIKAGEELLVRIKSEIETIGMKLTERSRSIETATGEALSKLEDASPLHIIAMSLESQLKRALDFTSMWLDLPPENEVKVNRDFAFTGDEVKAAEAVALAYANGAVTMETYINHLKEYGILMRSTDSKAEAKLAQAEFESRNKQKDLVKNSAGIQGALNSPKLG